MNITKRDGSLELVNLSKIETRIERLKYIKGVDNIPLNIDKSPIAIKVVQGLYEGVSSRELDELAAETAAGMITTDPEYEKIASRLAVSSLQKDVLGKFSDKTALLYSEGVLSKEYTEYVSNNSKFLDSIIRYDRDFLIKYFGIETLKRSYLLKVRESLIESPQDMWLRVATFIHKGNLDKIKECYDLMSNKDYTHATPTLFNAGTVRPQLSSCFLLDVSDDSISGIYKTISDCAEISQHAGGIGLSIHKIRSKGSHIKGTGGSSNGIVPMLRVFNETARYVDQGGGKRKGSFAVYLEPWHADIFDFLDLKKNHGKEETRARDLFYAMWIPDLFMRRVEENGDWTLFDPKAIRDNGTGTISKDQSFQETFLESTYGGEFEKKYLFLERSGKGVRTIKARDLWYKIIESQIETGTPYMLYKDSINEKSNQKNLGTIKSSNLCTEIVEYTDEKEIAVCNLASISLSKFVDKGVFDYKRLYSTSKIVCDSLNSVIDINHYPTKEAKASNLRHRPIGIGVQGLADVFAELKVPFESKEAKQINKNIFETMYMGALRTSITLAKEHGYYSSFKGSPASKGLLQFDLWGSKPSGNLDLDDSWDKIKDDIKKYGLRNSLLLAPMPTASTSQILGNNEAFEPFTSNIYTRRTLSGEFILVNEYLVKELSSLGLWDKEMKDDIISKNGSIQDITSIPEEIRLRYKTVWEMSMMSIIDMAADRGVYIDQSQSMNLWQSDPTFESLSSMHFYAWKKGLKTGMYYLRIKPKSSAIKGLGVDSVLLTKNELAQVEDHSDSVESLVCNIDDPDCLSCGS